MAANQCHYNFKVDGAKYRYVDIGCKFKKTEDVIKKVKKGSLALAKDWEIECPESKQLFLTGCSLLEIPATTNAKKQLIIKPYPVLKERPEYCSVQYNQ